MSYKSSYITKTAVEQLNSLFSGFNFTGQVKLSDYTETLRKVTSSLFSVRLVADLGKNALS